MNENNNTPLEKDIKEVQSVDTHQNIQETLASLSELHPENENIQTIKAMAEMFGENPKFLDLIHVGVQKLHNQVSVVENQGKRTASNIHKSMIAQLENMERSYDNPNDLLQQIV